MMDLGVDGTSPRCVNTTQIPVARTTSERMLPACEPNVALCQGIPGIVSLGCGLPPSHQKTRL